MSGNAIGVTYRWVAIIMTVVAALGWGVLFVMSPSAASVQDAQRQEIDRLQQEQRRLDAVAKEQRATSVELSELVAKLGATRDDLARAKEAYDLAQNALIAKKAEFSSTQASIASAQAELGSLEQKLSLTREQLTERTGTVRSSAVKTRKAERGKRIVGRKKRRG
jgi:septal ring factor EnvC (AmiA/AmiB activator)